MTDEEGWSLLHLAAARGQSEVINLLCEKGSRVDLIDNKGRTPLHYAAINGDIETIRLFIAMGSNVNSVDNEGNTPLKWSVMFEQNAAIEELTKHGGTVHIERMEPSTDNVKEIEPLLLPFQDSGHTLGDENNEVCNSNQTELTTDIQHVSTSTELNDSYKHSDHNSHQTDLVSTQQCMDTNADTTQLERDIFEAAQCGDTATVKGYLDLGLPVDVTDKDGWSPVHHAIAHRQVEVIRLLGCLMNPVKNRKQSTKSSDLHITTEGGSKYSTYDTKQLYEDIFEAARCGDTATIQLYLTSGGPVDFTDKDGRTLLHCAAGEGQIKVVELLIKRGCRIDPVDKNGCTPLDYATACGHEQTVQLLKQQLAEQGLGINIGDWTPLHAAATCGQLKSVRTLLRLGGRESMTKVAGTCGTPLHQAELTTDIHHVSTAAKLNDPYEHSYHNSCQTDLVTTNQYMDTNADTTQLEGDIFEAAKCGDTATVKGCLDSGVPVDITDEDGWSPVHHAIAHHQVEVIRLLMDRGCLMNPVKNRKQVTKGSDLHIPTEGGSKYSTYDTKQLFDDVFEAARCGDTATIQLYLNSGGPVDLTDKDGRTLLHCAAGEGQIKVVELLIKRGCRIDQVDKNGCTPLDYATACGHEQTVQILKQQSKEPLGEQYFSDRLDDRGRSVLHYFAATGDIHLIESMVEQGIYVNVGDDEGLTPLHYAAAFGQLESVCTLLGLGGRKSMTKVAGTSGTPLHQAVAGGHKDIVSLLLNEGCPINVVNSKGRSVLHWAAQYGEFHIMEMLTEQGLDVNIGDKEGWTPLHDAANCGELESVCTLLRLGGRESMTKVAGKRGTPLHQAVGKGHKDIVSLLLNEGCPIYVVDSGGASVLHFAAEGSQIHIMEMLTEQGLDVNIGDKEGWTPFHDAANCGELESVRTLLRLGGRESMTKVAGKSGTPLHQAVGKGHKDIVSLLLNEGCPIYVVDSGGASVLHYAIQGGQIHMIEMLAEHGLDVNIGDNEGRTSLHDATLSGHVTTFKELVNVGGDIHHMDKFGMKFSDCILISQSSATVKQFCVACGLECDDGSPLGVISALSANDLLDMNRILCLAAVGGDMSIFDAMVTSPYPLNEQKMPKIANFLSFKSGGKKLPDHFHVSEEPLNPLQISILSEYFHFSPNIIFIEKLTSHPRTRYTVNELFPNGLSPLDVARRFELQDIAVIIERAGGGPGAWADLPKEIEDKAIDRFTTLKELRRGLGENVTARIVSLLGYPLVTLDQQEVNKILEDKPMRSLMQKHVLSSLKHKTKWKRVGDLLEVEEDILEKIGEESIDDDDAYYSMLVHWLKHGRNVSWKKLLEAVGHFETKKTVDDITDKIVDELTPSQVSIKIRSFHF